MVEQHHVCSIHSDGIVPTRPQFEFVWGSVTDFLLGPPA
jgi:hypothetical protein